MKITTGQLAVILKDLETLLFAKPHLVSTMKGHEIDYAETALYMDHLVDKLNDHFKVKLNKRKKLTTRDIEKVELKFNYWAIHNAYPPTLHTEYLKNWMPFIQEDIQTQEDFDACLLAVKKYRDERLEDERKLASNRKFTKKFSNWIREWRAHVPVESAPVQPVVLDPSERGF